jgi:hypothetical protein
MSSGGLLMTGGVPEWRWGIQTQAQVRFPLFLKAGPLASLLCQKYKILLCNRAAVKWSWNKRIAVQGRLAGRGDGGQCDG